MNMKHEILCLEIGKMLERTRLEAVNLDRTKKRFDAYVDAVAKGRKLRKDEQLTDKEICGLDGANRRGKDRISKKTARHLGLKESFTYAMVALRCRDAVCRLVIAKVLLRQSLEKPQ